MPSPDLRRGDCVRLRSPRGAHGHEQQGERFGVVLQGDEFARLSTVIIAPTSTSARDATFRPAVEIDGSATRVLVEHMGAVDPARLGPLVDRLDGLELAAVDDAVRLLLDV